MKERMNKLYQSVKIRRFAFSWLYSSLAFCPFGASGLTDLQVSKMAAKRRVTQDQICLKYAFQRHLSVVTR